MQQAQVKFEGRNTTFNIQNMKDHIQEFHLSGHFYEQRQLLCHRDVIPMGCSVIDVGANIGNHTLFYAKYTWAKTIYPFEPNPTARELLRKNIDANGDFRALIETENMHFGIGRSATQMQLIEAHENNLGGTKLRKADIGGSIDCRRLDEFTFDGWISFVKIDVEGMEIDVLLGAETLISRFRPIIAVEVSETNEQPFWAWARFARYQPFQVFSDYLHQRNYLMVPTS